MFQDEMVEIEKSDKIQNLFVNLLREKNKIVLWQNIDNIHRIKKAVCFRKFDTKKSELEFLPKKGQFKFDVQLPIYFYSKKKTTIFKNGIFFNSQFNLIVKAPELVMLKNIRKEKRESCLNSLVSFMFGEDNYGRDSWFKAKMIDRSAGGFSFKTSIGNVIKFKVGQKLQFKFDSMEIYVEGKIVNVVSYFEDGKKFKRISVRKLS